MASFWDRRRAAVAAEEATLEAEVQEAKLAERTDEEILAELELPEPEALESPDAVRDFLKAELPQRLKTRALRRLWRLNPVLANLDGLVDYGEDFTDSATVIENMQTVYQVGKGMLTALTEEPEADIEEDVEEAEDVLLAEAEPEEAREITPTPLPDPEPEAPAMPQRRMRFVVQQA
ncbi:MAG: DUF3306 domain-containing protein [Pseudomonadota bacterium]